MNIAIMTDENSGISVEEAGELGVYVLKMPIIIDEQEYFEDINLTHEEFYEALMSGKDITTSQPSPGEVMDMWDKILADGADQIVYIPMSSGLSSSCQNALGYVDEYDGKIQVVDNHRISVTLRQSVMDALHLAQSGKDACEIKKILEETAYDASIYISVDTLEFLVKSGRVTPSGAALGMMLNIKPILTIQGDKLDAFAKVRGIKKCESKMIDAIQNDLVTRFSNVDPKDISMATVSSFLDENDAKAWHETVKEAFPDFDVRCEQLSLSIGSHIGPNGVAIAISQIIR